jgi:ATP-dependent Clp protease, protease subunit
MGEGDWPLVYPPGTAPGPTPGTFPATPAAGTLPEALARRLFEQRVVLLHGPLDDTTVARTSAELMTLDSEGDEPVTLRVDSGEGSLALALTLMDVVELMGVPVHALCLGQVGAGAVGVVAVCARRVAMPSTRFALCEPRTEQSPVHVRNVAQWSELRTEERERFCARVAAAAGRAVEHVRDDLVKGRFLDASAAVAYGLVDEVSRRDAEISRLPGAGPSPMGFRPRD